MSATPQDILVHTEAGVTTVTLNRVDKKNSLTRAMYATLADTLAQAEADASVRAVLLQGDITVFSAGNDIGDFLAQPPAEQDAPVFRFLRAIAAFPKPLVAAVCGPAVGIGTTMLFHCDLVYAGDNAAFSMPFVNLGLCPEAASSLLAPRLLGYHRAAEALLLGEPFMAEAAMEVGLVNRVVPPTECNAIAQAQARKLAAKPLSALDRDQAPDEEGHARACAGAHGRGRRQLRPHAARACGSGSLHGVHGEAATGLQRALKADAKEGCALEANSTEMERVHRGLKHASAVRSAVSARTAAVECNPLRTGSEIRSICRWDQGRFDGQLFEPLVKFTRNAEREAAASWEGVGC